MSETKGTTETMNVINLAFTVAEQVAKELAGDGLQWSDAIRILTSTDFQSKVAEAVADFSELPGEIADLSTYEALDLAQEALSGAKRVIQALERAA